MDGTAGTASQSFGGYRTQQKAEHPLQGLSDSEAPGDITISLYLLHPGFFWGCFCFVNAEDFNHKTCFHMPCCKAALCFLQTWHSSNQRLPAQHWHGNTAAMCARAGKLRVPAQPSPGALQGPCGPPEWPGLTGRTSGAPVLHLQWEAVINHTAVCCGSGNEKPFIGNLII